MYVSEIISYTYIIYHNNNIYNNIIYIYIYIYIIYIYMLYILFSIQYTSFISNTSLVLGIKSLRHRGERAVLKNSALMAE